MAERQRDKSLPIRDYAKELYSYPAAAVALDISRVKVRQLVTEGKIRAVALGPKCKRIPRSEIERVVAGGAA